MGIGAEATILAADVKRRTPKRFGVYEGCGVNFSMLTRREVLAGGLVAGIAGFLRREDPHAAAAQPHTKVSIAVPPGATDCAVHVFGDTKRHPYWEGRTYTPEPATVAELQQVMRALGVERVVVVQASTYGTDNSCVLDSIRELGAGARGVAVIDEKTTEASLDDLQPMGLDAPRVESGGKRQPSSGGGSLQQSAARNPQVSFPAERHRGIDFLNRSNPVCYATNPKGFVCIRQLWLCTAE